MKIEDEFIPNEQALDLIELGIDKDIALYHRHSRDKNLYSNLDWELNLNWDYAVPAFLYQQAFRFFRKTCKIESEIKKIEEGYTFHCFKNQDELVNSLCKLFGEDREKYVYKTSEEAELECLKKLIQIVKEKGYEKHTFITNGKTK